MSTWHVGRSFSGNRQEQTCPCSKAPCGLVIDGSFSWCEEHGERSPLPLRQAHRAENCPVIADVA